MIKADKICTHRNEVLNLFGQLDGQQYVWWIVSQNVRIFENCEFQSYCHQRSVAALSWTGLFERLYLCYCVKTARQQYCILSLKNVDFHQLFRSIFIVYIENIIIPIRHIQ